MVPMRSVPHRVVCLLGLDDGVFPRQRIVDGDDVLARTAGHRRARHPLRGPPAAPRRDRRRDRDARRHLHRRRPAQRAGPAARRTPRRAARRPRPHDRRRRCATRSWSQHPLQPYDVRNVEPGRLGVPDAVHASTRGCSPPPRAATGPRPAPPPFLVAPLAAPVSRTPGDDDIALADLVTFFRDPVKGFFRALDLTLPWDVDAVSDAMPVEIDQLETWGVGDRMLEDMLRGIHPDKARGDRVAARRPATRPARLAQGHRGPRDRDEPRRRRAHPPPGRAAARTTSTSTLGGGRRLTGTVTPGLRRPAGRGRLLQARRQAPARVVGAAARPRGRAPGPQLDRADDRPRAARHARPPSDCSGPPSDEPLGLLEDLVAPLRRRPPRAAARCRSRPPSPGRRRCATARTRKAEAVKKWKSSRYPGEDAEPAHVRVWGEHADLDDCSPTCRRWPSGSGSPLLDSERGPL